MEKLRQSWSNHANDSKTRLISAGISATGRSSPGNRAREDHVGKQAGGRRNIIAVTELSIDVWDLKKRYCVWCFGRLVALQTYLIQNTNSMSNVLSSQLAYENPRNEMGSEVASSFVERGHGSNPMAIAESFRRPGRRGAALRLHHTKFRFNRWQEST